MDETFIRILVKTGNSLFEKLAANRVRLGVGDGNKIATSLKKRRTLINATPTLRCEHNTRCTVVRVEDVFRHRRTQDHLSLLGQSIYTSCHDELSGPALKARVQYGIMINHTNLLHKRRRNGEEPPPRSHTAAAHVAGIFSGDLRVLASRGALYGLEKHDTPSTTISPRPECGRDSMH